MSISVGDTLLKAVIELESVDFPHTMFFDAEDKAAMERAVDARMDWLAPQHYHRAERILRLSHHAWLVDTGRHRILIDPCVGNHKPRRMFEFYNMLDIPWLDRLAAAGAEPEDIDYVFCTHLHVDHCGWNTRLVDGRWVPTFPNARYVFSKREAAYWARELSGPLEPENDFNFGVYSDSVLPVIEAGQAMVLEGELTLADCLTVESGSGHTPGHLIATLRSRNDGAVFAGDAIHHPLQIFNPDWNTNGCFDRAQARATRRRILSMCADQSFLLAPAHFRAPHAFRIARDSANFRILD